MLLRVNRVAGIRRLKPFRQAAESVKIRFFPFRTNLISAFGSICGLPSAAQVHGHEAHVALGERKQQSRGRVNGYSGGSMKAIGLRIHRPGDRSFPEIGTFQNPISTSTPSGAFSQVIRQVPDAASHVKQSPACSGFPSMMTVFGARGSSTRMLLVVSAGPLSSKA